MKPGSGMMQHSRPLFPGWPIGVQMLRSPTWLCSVVTLPGIPARLSTPLYMSPRSHIHQDCDYTITIAELYAGSCVMHLKYKKGAQEKHIAARVGTLTRVFSYCKRA
jgi:hypothetical protein